MAQLDPFLLDPQVEDLIPAGLDDLLQEIYDGFDYEELGDIPPAEDLYDPDEDSEGCWIPENGDDGDLLYYTNDEVI